jgi:4'-phosphopantetheinyl transferase
MIDVLFTVVQPFVDEQIILSTLQLLSAHQQQAILAYQQPIDRQLRSLGKLLLKESISRFGLANTINIQMLEMAKNGKPHLNNILFFNASYTVDTCILAACEHTEIGIDIEKIQQVDIQLYEAYFTKNEWTKIIAADSITNTFFDFWTRKEAVLKAAGKGLDDVAMKDIEVINNQVLFNGNTFFIQKLDLPTEYTCHIATSVSDSEIQIEKFDIV